mmetsp:Transcript_77/g.86  ORF Transcript_77/g.86 Transcript_77/m.86 type:complete len:145 (+) Transcript_77:1429-1863(+)
MCVSCCRLHLKYPFVNREQRNIESTTTKIKNEDISFATTLLLVETISDSSSGGFVDDPLDLQPGDHPSILRGLTLAVVKVGRDSNHRIANRLPEVALCDFLHLGQHHRGDLLRGELLGLPLVLHLDGGLVPWLADHCKRPVLHV